MPQKFLDRCAGNYDRVLDVLCSMRFDLHQMTFDLLDCSVNRCLWLPSGVYLLKMVSICFDHQSGVAEGSNLC